MLPVWIVEDVVLRALAEDVGSGDLTTNALVDEESTGVAAIYSKEAGVLAGMPVAERVFHVLDPGAVFEGLLAEGSDLAPGGMIARVRASGRALLTGERTALNFLRHLSGIATATRHLAGLIAGTGARLVDTRKTTPGLRVLEKYAVRVGGGHNHRTGLFDGILIKDNHIKLAGGITAAVKRARDVSPHTIRVEVEVEGVAQLEEALDAGADLVLLDNMTSTQMRDAVRLAGGRALLEASGNIGAANIRAVAETGVNLISVGAITHSAPALDISMDVGEIKQQCSR
jgi:nicotinate-nucleotide pyrophosphorylase (carboxylating)